MKSSVGFGGVVRILIWVLLVMAAAQAGPLTERLGKTVLFDDVAIAPDGRRVAWVQSTAAGHSSVMQVSSTAPASKAVPARVPAVAEVEDSGAAWSPDSRTLAFVSTGEVKDVTVLWRVTADGSVPPRRTLLKGYAARPKWAHNGRQIALLFIDGAGGGGPLAAAPALTGVIDTAFHNQRIAILDVSSGEVRTASTPDLNVYDFDWSPDDQAFVATAAPGPGDNNWWIAQLYVIDAVKGSAESVYKPKLQLAIPRWSPDGRSLAFIEGLMSDEGFHGGDLFTVPARGGAAVNRTPGRKSSVSSIFWNAPDRILFTENVGGGSAVGELSIKDNSTRLIWKGDGNVHAFGNFPNLSVSPNGESSAVVRDSFANPPEVWVGQVGQWRQLTRENEGQEPAWGSAESLEWKKDGFNVQGWLLPPKELLPNVRYPMVVLIHGGPAGVAQPGWPSKGALAAVLASQGYFVFMPNPRGSYGQGEAFTRANVRDFGGGDLRDVLAGVDAVLARHPVDSNRLGVAGWSYGGYMTMWTVTQTQRFRAAVAGAGIANWQSYYGQNLIDQWMIPYFGASVYDNPAVYAKSSPMNYIRNVKTPTLILVGERDAECPAPQSFEFWHALKARSVLTELVVYAGEGHMFMNPTNRLDKQDRTLSWFNQYLR